MKDTLKTTKNILSQYAIRASKRFGQNFLIDDTVLESIVEISDITKEDLVIEIGPGLGNLTEYLLEKAGQVIAIEIDTKMIDIVTERFSKVEQLKIIPEDVLKIKMDQLIHEIEEEKNTTYSKVKVVANLPYYITTPILFKLLQEESRISEITVMVQKEVAERMVAKSRTKAYGILTVMVDYLADANIGLIVPSESFIPAPDVTSAVIHLVKNKKYPIKEEKMLFDLIHCSFAKRRKKMINSLHMSSFLQMDKKSIESLFDACEIGYNTRAEELPLTKYIEIVKKIALIENNEKK